MNYSSQRPHERVFKIYSRTVRACERLKLHCWILLRTSCNPVLNNIFFLFISIAAVPFITYFPSEKLVAHFRFDTYIHGIRANAESSRNDSHFVKYCCHFNGSSSWRTLATKSCSYLINRELYYT